MSTNTKIVTGLDLLKFIMCIMIVSIHTNGFAWPSWLNITMMPFVGQSVPVFFETTPHAHISV